MRRWQIVILLISTVAIAVFIVGIAIVAGIGIAREELQGGTWTELLSAAVAVFVGAVAASFAALAAFESRKATKFAELAIATAEASHEFRLYAKYDYLRDGENGPIWSHRISLMLDTRGGRDASPVWVHSARMTSAAFEERDDHGISVDESERILEEWGGAEPTLPRALRPNEQIAFTDPYEKLYAPLAPLSPYSNARMSVEYSITKAGRHHTYDLDVNLQELQDGSRVSEWVIDTSPGGEDGVPAN